MTRDDAPASAAGGRYTSRMDVHVERAGGFWVVKDGDAPVRTPGGTPLVSRHRALLDEVAADVARWGPDPTRKTTTLSLQASYLDFGIPVRREVLEENTASIWPDDLLVHRPRGAEGAALLALWGPPGPDRVAFRDALRALTLRQLMATRTAGRVLHSAALGLRVVCSADGLAPLAVGACGVRFPGARHVPTERDEPFCDGPCRAAAPAGVPGDAAAFQDRCALLPLLDKMRRWAAFPEEVERRG